MKRLFKRVGTLLLMLVTMAGVASSCMKGPVIVYAAETTWNYAYTGSIQSFTAPQAGTYNIVAYGAAGGATWDSGGWQYNGSGGYSTGNIALRAGQTIYIVVGGMGSVSSTGGSPGGYNGGGASASAGAGSGGGATSISFANGLLSSISVSDIILVAGGGGGQGAHTPNGAVTFALCNGGGDTGGRNDRATGGSQSSGYSQGRGQSAEGGNGAGGGGYFGGYASSNSAYGGGGGSGYVNPEFLSSSSTNITNHRAAGSVTITYKGPARSTVILEANGNGKINGQETVTITGNMGDVITIPTPVPNESYIVFEKYIRTGGDGTISGTTYTFGQKTTYLTASYSGSTAKLETTQVGDKVYVSLNAASVSEEAVELQGKADSEASWETLGMYVVGNVQDFLNKISKTVYNGQSTEYTALIPGTYSFSLRGSGGGADGNTYGGNGASMSFTAYMDKGQKIKLISSTNGTNSDGDKGIKYGGGGIASGGYGCWSGGGGGASGIQVYKNGAWRTLAIAAGGGGGNWATGYGGRVSSNNSGNVGGSNGQDGIWDDGDDDTGGGGAGWYGGVRGDPPHRGGYGGRNGYDSSVLSQFGNLQESPGSNGGGHNTSYVSVSPSSSTSVASVGMADKLIITIKDVMAPGVPSQSHIVSSDINSVKLFFETTEDFGNNYSIRVPNYTSAKTFFYTSGFNGWRYVIDSSPSTQVKATDTYVSTANITIAASSAKRYCHVAAVDKAGNISGTFTIELPRTTSYVVEHYKMDVNGTTYTLASRETFYGLVGEVVSPSTKPYAGFVIPAVQTKVLAESGNLFQYYYVRKKYPYEIHYYFQNINGTGYTEDPNLVASIKTTAYYEAEIAFAVPSVPGYKHKSTVIADGGSLNNNKITIVIENPETVAKKNVVSVYYNWDDGNNPGGSDTAKNLALVTFDTNKLNWHIDPGANISTSWKWSAPTSTTNSSAYGFETPENIQGYFVQRLYAEEGSNITTGYGAYISRGRSEVPLKTVGTKYKGTGGNSGTWGGDFPTVTATGCTFLGWNSKADGSGTWYSTYGTGNKSGSDKDNTAILALDSANKKYGLTITLFAIWADNTAVTTNITYNQGIVNDITGIAGTPGDLAPLFENKTSQTISNSGSTITLPWAKDVTVNIIGQDKATGNYIFYSKLIGADNSHKNQDAGTTTIYAAGLGEDSGVTNVLTNTFKRNTATNKSKTTSGAYTQNAGVYHLDYDIQGTYALSVRNESREYEEAIKAGVIQGDPAYKHLNNIFKIKIDNTAPVITSWRVVQDRLENYKSSEVEDAIASGLYTTFKITFNDAHNSARGVYLNQKDTSGIHGIYIRVWDKNDTSSVKVYSIPLEMVTNQTLTDNEDAAIFSGTVVYPINLYTEFPKASTVIYEAYVVDNAGNVTEKIGSVLIDSDRPSDPDEGPEEPSDPNDPTPSPAPDYPSGTLTNYSIKTVIYNDKDEEFNVEDFVTYETMPEDTGAFFQTGDMGHVDVWTIGYVTSVSSDFGAGAGDMMAEEAIDEISSGRLPIKYNMGLDSSGDYKRTWNYSIGEMMKPKFIQYYDEDLHKMVIVYRDASVKSKYSDKAYTTKEQETYNKLLVNDGVPYAVHYTTKEDVILDDTSGWLANGTKVRIPPYYQMKHPYDKSEKTHSDGTTAYKTETHTYKATAYKNGDTLPAYWIYMIYDTGSNDLHFRIIHENGVG